MILYRPIGLKELQLIAESDFKEFPPRLPEQPIFYPVLNLEYAVQIARDWNAKDPPDYAGFVAKFELEQAYAEKWEMHTVGSKIHQELWILAEELAEFNRHIIGRIEIVGRYTNGSENNTQSFQERPKYGTASNHRVARCWPVHSFGKFLGILGQH